MSVDNHGKMFPLLPMRDQFNVMRDAMGATDPKHYDIKPHSYKLRLMSDEELKTKSEIIFTLNFKLSNISCKPSR